MDEDEEEEKFVFFSKKKLTKIPITSRPDLFEKGKCIVLEDLEEIQNE